MRVEIIDLKKEFDEFLALDSVCLSLDTGMYGLLGANGAGKTTLMKILAGIMSRTSGEIRINGNSIKRTGQLRKEIGYIPQKFSFYPQMTVYQVMDYFSALNKVKMGRRKRILQLLELAHLMEKIDVKVCELSGGMIQRLGIAVAFIKDPWLLIVDEPTVGLDPKERIHFNNALSNFSEKKTIFISSHIVSDIDATCNKLAVLNHGRIIFQGSKSDIINDCTDKVWELQVSWKKAQELEKKFSISRKRVDENGVVLRMISDHIPESNAVNVTPDLNDAYVYKIDCDEGESE